MHWKLLVAQARVQLPYLEHVLRRDDGWLVIPAGEALLGYLFSGVVFVQDWSANLTYHLALEWHDRVLSKIVKPVSGLKPKPIYL